MDLTNYITLEKWKDLEDEIHTKSGLNSSVFDLKGTRITGSECFVNQICPVIKENPKGQTFICSLAHQSIVNQVLKNQKSVIDECDAGLVKLAVPIFLKDRIQGVVGCCGLLPPNGEVDTFLIQKTIGGDEDVFINLCEEIGTISEKQLTELLSFIEQKIQHLKQDISIGVPN